MKDAVSSHSAEVPDLWQIAPAGSLQELARLHPTWVAQVAAELGLLHEMRGKQNVPLSHFIVALAQVRYWRGVADRRNTPEGRGLERTAIAKHCAQALADLSRQPRGNSTSLRAQLRSVGGEILDGKSRWAEERDIRLVTYPWLNAWHDSEELRKGTGYSASRFRDHLRGILTRFADDEFVRRRPGRSTLCAQPIALEFLATTLRGRPKVRRIGLARTVWKWASAGRQKAADLKAMAAVLQRLPLS